MTLPKSYNPKEFEDDIYQNWEAKGYFTPEINADKAPFSIVMPPPNITGQLHIGHALNNTLQDIIIRHKRMQGFSALWLPGTDHASIATEVKIVEKLKEEGLDKKTIGRQEFLRHAYLWKDKYGGRIVKQLRKLGSSCDWSREAFTMDDKCSKAVREVFVNLYKKGLIYQGNRIINWCTDCRTALSDAEVEYEEKEGNLWHIFYPFNEGEGGIIVATTRPETMLGDVAVAVNPDDDRYKDLVGKMLKLPLTDRLIPIIADNYVEKEFGSGAVKITPAHDPNDYEVGMRHGLQPIVVMNDDGTMNQNAYDYKGVDRFEARKRVVDDLRKASLLVKIEKHKHNVGECYRCGKVVEPLISKQWFVKMQPLAKPAIQVVKNKKVSFVPDRFTKIYLNWMENVRDWCISRQLWWGHQIPAWHCQECGEIVVEKFDPTCCPKCKSHVLCRDEDVLDTWFSSALWPFSTLGYPELTEDLKYFYPTNVLVTGSDIIFFWVARMIFSGLSHMGEIPFAEVLINGIVRDSQGRKMSKSLNNGVDPLELIDKYGADSLRFSLCVGAASGSDIRFSEDKMEPSRNFMNKIWNASRFVLANVEGVKITDICETELESKDKWILYKLNKLVSEVNSNLKRYDTGLASTKLYEFVWNDFCDWYIELSKPSLYGEDEKAKQRTVSVLMFLLKSILKLLHPFIPFITERIYKECGEGETIMTQKYPSTCKKFMFAKDYQRFEGIKDIIRSIRNVRAEKGVLQSKSLPIMVISSEKAYLKRNAIYIQRLANVSDISYISDKDNVSSKTVSIVLERAEILIDLGELVDIEKEIERLNKELAAVKKEIERSESMLNNQGFIAKAPKPLIEKEQEKLKVSKELADKLRTRISEL